MLPMLAGLLLALAPRAFAQDLAEYEVKAGFLYHFAAFTEWPSDVGSTINVCVLGADVAPEIEKLAGRKLDARKLAVTRLRSLDAIGPCQIVFVPRQHSSMGMRVVEAARDHPILTVGETDGLARAGFVINLVLIDDRVRFEINGEAARRAKLALSSKLLRLASTVY